MFAIKIFHENKKIIHERQQYIIVKQACCVYRVKSEICMRFDEDLQQGKLQQQLGWGLLETVVDTQLPS